MSDWSPEQCELRAGETPDADALSHARRNLEQLQDGVNAGLLDPGATDSMTERVERIEAFIREKESGRSQVHRLRSWAVGDTVYGYEIVRPNRGRMGKTFRHESPHRTPAEERARKAFDGVLSGPLSTDGADVFLYKATIARLHANAPDPYDPGEPPLKFANLTDVQVIDHHLDTPADEQ